MQHLQLLLLLLALALLCVVPAVLSGQQRRSAGSWFPHILVQEDEISIHTPNAVYRLYSKYPPYQWNDPTYLNRGGYSQNEEFKLQHQSVHSISHFLTKLGYYDGDYSSPNYVIRPLTLWDICQLYANNYPKKHSEIDSSGTENLESSDLKKDSSAHESKSTNKSSNETPSESFPVKSSQTNKEESILHKTEKDNIVSAITGSKEQIYGGDIVKHLSQELPNTQSIKVNSSNFSHPQLLDYNKAHENETNEVSGTKSENLHSENSVAVTDSDLLAAMIKPDVIGYNSHQDTTNSASINSSLHEYALQYPNIQFNATTSKEYKIENINKSEDKSNILPGDSISDNSTKQTTAVYPNHNTEASILTIAEFGSQVGENVVSESYNLPTLSSLNDSQEMVSQNQSFEISALKVHSTQKQNADEHLYMETTPIGLDVHNPSTELKEESTTLNYENADELSSTRSPLESTTLCDLANSTPNENSDHNAEEGLLIEIENVAVFPIHPLNTLIQSPGSEEIHESVATTTYQTTNHQNNINFNEANDDDAIVFLNNQDIQTINWENYENHKINSDESEDVHSMPPASDVEKSGNTLEVAVNNYTKDADLVISNNQLGLSHDNAKHTHGGNTDPNLSENDKSSNLFFQEEVDKSSNVDLAELPEEQYETDDPLKLVSSDLNIATKSDYLPTLPETVFKNLTNEKQNINLAGDDFSSKLNVNETLKPLSNVLENEGNAELYPENSMKNTNEIYVKTDKTSLPLDYDTLEANITEIPSAKLWEETSLPEDHNGSIENEILSSTSSNQISDTERSNVSDFVQQEDFSTENVKYEAEIYEPTGNGIEGASTLNTTSSSLLPFSNEKEIAFHYQSPQDTVTITPINSSPLDYEDKMEGTTSDDDSLTIFEQVGTGFFDPSYGLYTSEITEPSQTVKKYLNSIQESNKASHSSTKTDIGMLSQYFVDSLESSEDFNEYDEQPEKMYDAGSADMYDEDLPGHKNDDLEENGDESSFETLLQKPSMYAVQNSPGLGHRSDIQIEEDYFGSQDKLVTGSSQRHRRHLLSEERTSLEKKPGTLQSLLPSKDFSLEKENVKNNNRAKRTFGEFPLDFLFKTPELGGLLGMYKAKLLKGGILAPLLHKKIDFLEKKMFFLKFLSGLLGVPDHGNPLFKKSSDTKFLPHLTEIFDSKTKLEDFPTESKDSSVDYHSSDYNNHGSIDDSGEKSFSTNDDDHLLI